jgi:hypothetical protein
MLYLTCRHSGLRRIQTNTANLFANADSGVGKGIPLQQIFDKEKTPGNIGSTSIDRTTGLNMEGGITGLEREGILVWHRNGDDRGNARRIRVLQLNSLHCPKS